MKEHELHWYDEVDTISANETDIIKHSEHQSEKNIKAFLDTIAYAEGTILFGDQDGYNVIVGGQLFHSYKDHPRILVNLPNLGIKSSASGRYQVLQRYWDHYAPILGLKDFSPANQDTYAINMFVETRALKDIETGNFDDAARKVASRWASFPNAGYGQPEKKLSELRDYYIKMGGKLNA